MRALVVSDSHLGAWTGEELLRHPAALERLAPHLDGIDEVIFLGDLFDFLFATVQDAVAAADGLLDLLRCKLQGRRFVFLAGNHDHHLIVQEAEDLRDLRIATGRPADELEDELARGRWLRRLLERRLEGVEVDVRYPTYSFGGVLCTHGHYLDIHAHRHGSALNWLLARVLWHISEGEDDPATGVADYEGAITMLTEVLYLVAQLPNGTRTQRQLDHAIIRAGNVIGALAQPLDASRRLAGRVGERLGDGGGGRDGERDEVGRAHYRAAQRHEVDRRARRGTPRRGQANASRLVRVVRPSDPNGPALDAFHEVVETLAWAPPSGRIVFAHTHQPLVDVTCRAGRVRYWNTGSWIYEPDLSSHQAYASYLRNGWPGTAILIDTDEPDPRLIETLSDLNPLSGAASERGEAPPAIARALGFAGDGR